MKTFFRAIPKRSLPVLRLAAFVLLGASGAIDAQSRASDHLIVPGERIGPIFIGMTETQLYQKLGNPSNTVRGSNGAWILYEYKNLGLSTIVNPYTHKVNTVQITQSDSPYSTREGITGGSSELQVQTLPWKLLWKREAEPHALGVWTFAYTGIQITTQNGNVINIKVLSTSSRDFPKE